MYAGPHHIDNGSEAATMKLETIGKIWRSQEGWILQIGNCKPSYREKKIKTVNKGVFFEGQHLLSESLKCMFYWLFVCKSVLVNCYSKRPNVFWQENSLLVFCLLSTGPTFRSRCRKPKDYFSNVWNLRRDFGGGRKNALCCDTESGSVSQLKSAVTCKTLQLERFPPSPSASRAAVLSGKVTGFTDRTQNLPQSLFLTIHVFSSDNIFNYNTNCVLWSFILVWLNWLN